METALLRSIDELKTELDQMAETEPEALIEAIGERLSRWELLVRQTQSYDLALRIGELLEKVNHWWLALSWYQWVTKSIPNEAKDDVECRALRSKGRVYIRLGMYEEALPLFQQVEQFYEAKESVELQDLQSLYQNISLSFEQLGQYEMALIYAERTLELLDQQNDQYRVAIVHMMVGMNLNMLKRYEEACIHLTRARDSLEMSGDHYHLARAWHNYAELMCNWGRPEEAVAAWRMSLEMKKKSHDHQGQVTTMLSITQYLVSQQDWHGALGYITQVFPLCHQHRLYDQEIQCLEQWSEILVALGRYSELEVVATRANYLSQCVTKKHHVISLLQKVSVYFQQIGEEQLAEQYHMNAVHLN